MGRLVRVLSSSFRLSKDERNDGNGKGHMLVRFRNPKPIAI